MSEAAENIAVAFHKVPRPEQFIRGTCWCDECVEHNETLASHSPETIGMAELGSPAWDPICFASDAAFAYYLPALVRLAFNDDYYYDQFLFHLGTPGRLDGLSPAQRKALLDAIWMLAEVKEEMIFGSFDEYTLGQVITKLEQSLQNG